MTHAVPARRTTDLVMPVAALDQRIGDLGRQHDAGNRQIARRQALGDGGHVRREAQSLVAEPAARSPEAADHLVRSEEHTSELQSLMRISYAVFCLKKKKPN